MRKIEWFNADELVHEAQKKINQVNIVLDVGCGIRPQRLTRTFIHVCVDAHKQYLAVLKDRIITDKGIRGRLKYLYVNTIVDKIIKLFPDKSFDSIFLLDVIEHLEKQKGLDLINSFKKIARHQIVIFTPIGFVKQEHPDGKDAWGLDGGTWQEHKSGWTPEDFDDSWEFVACKAFHKATNLGESIEIPVGAFFAIKTVNDPPSLINQRNFIIRVLFWLKSFLFYNKLKKLIK